MDALQSIDLVERDHDRNAELEDATRDEAVTRADALARRAPSTTASTSSNDKSTVRCMCSVSRLDALSALPREQAASSPICLRSCGSARTRPSRRWFEASARGSSNVPR